MEVTSVDKVLLVIFFSYNSSIFSGKMASNPPRRDNKHLREMNVKDKCGDLPR